MLENNEQQFEQVREWAATVAQQFENSFVCGDRVKEKAVPLFEPGELLKSGSGEPCGEYFDVIEIGGVLLNPASTHKRITEKSKQQSQRVRFAERANNGGSYSIKLLRSDVVKNVKQHRDAAAAMVIETKFLIHLSHPNIIKLYGMTVEGMSSLSRPGKQGFFTILESVQETLEQRLERWMIDGCNDSDTMTRRLEVGEDLSSALVFLSNRKIIFGALRPENVGFDANFGRLKLMNFGNAREECQVHFVSNESEHTNMKVLPYTAPEVLRKEKPTRKSDIYSFGVLLWTLLSLEHPFEGMDASKYIQDSVEADARPPIQESWSSAVCDLMRSCWKPNPRDRPNIMKVQEALEGALVGQFFTEEEPVSKMAHTPPTSNEASAEFDEFESICQRSMSASRSSTFSNSFSESDDSVSTFRLKEPRRTPLSAPFASHSSSMHLLETLVDMAAKEKMSYDYQDNCDKCPVRSPVKSPIRPLSAKLRIDKDKLPCKPPLTKTRKESAQQEKRENMPSSKPPKPMMTLEQAEKLFNASDSCIGRMPNEPFVGGDGGSLRNIGFQTRRSNFAPLAADAQLSTPVPATPIRAAKALLNRMKSPIGIIPLTDEDEDDANNGSIRDGRSSVSKRVSKKRYATVEA
jgi:serine/threonine protein kinase